MNNLYFKIFSLVILGSLLLSGFTSAQIAPQFLTSWRAESYVPSWYQGKVLPTKGTIINVSFELVSGSKAVDLSRQKVRWYVNDELVKNEDNGLGIKTLRFIIPDYPGNQTEVRISLPEYQNGLDELTRISVVRPEAVIDSRRAIRQLKVGDNAFSAIPFFFNIKNPGSLSFDWFANDQKEDIYSENPWAFNLNIDSKTPADYPVGIKLVIQNALDQMETASRFWELNVSK